MATTDPLLIQAVQELDAGTRALLDLSLRRAISDERVAAALGVQLAEIPRRRARGISELADKLAVPGPAELALLLVALPGLPEEAWGVPDPSHPKAGSVSRARRARAFRRVAVAASPLVAAAAVMAALIVSSGGTKQVHVSVASSQGAGQQEVAAASKAPATSTSKTAEMPKKLSAPDIIASADGPTPADLPRATATRQRAQRIRKRHAATHRVKRHKAVKKPVVTPPSADKFASSVPRPDAYVAPAKPKVVHKRKRHVHRRKPTTPTVPTPQPDVTAPLTNNQTTSTPPPIPQITPQPPVIKKAPDGDGGSAKKTYGSAGNGCGHGGSGDGNSQPNDQGNGHYQKPPGQTPDQQSLLGIFKKHREGGNYSS
jgi:hypothetical protein